jgi:hypothetical protein
MLLLLVGWLVAAPTTTTTKTCTFCKLSAKAGNFAHFFVPLGMCAQKKLPLS